VPAVKQSGCGEYGSRYREHQIRDESDFEKHADYIHYNPVKHSYVNRPIDWRYSTLSHLRSSVWLDIPSM